MRMFIEGSLNGTPQPSVCRQAAEAAIGFLEQVASHRTSVQAPAWTLPEPSGHLLIHAMWAAAQSVGDRDLTPMAAVAGTIADATADFLVNVGLTRVVINNGGDCAIRLSQGESISVGIRPDIGSGRVTHRVVLTADMNVGGVCTSGLGGRSFTRGIASAATVFATRAAIADAAATAVANATYVESPQIGRILAERIDPNTDLKGIEITESVGDLSETEIAEALAQAIVHAEELVTGKVIQGACVVVKGRMECTENIADLLEPLVTA